MAADATTAPCSPRPALSYRGPFDYHDWLVELKHDGRYSHWAGRLELFERRRDGKRAD